MKFFESKDITEFGKWSNKEYCKPDTTHQKFMSENMKPLFQQTKYWANEVSRQLPGFTVTTGKYLKRGRKAGTTLTVPVFQAYTWAMIVPEEYKNAGVYFTVGVDASSHSLLYKLDCERIADSFSKKRRMSVLQQNHCCDYIDSQGGLRRQIKDQDIINTNWDTLVNETSAFVDEHLPHYMKLINIATL